MEYLKHQSPFVVAALNVTITSRRIVLSLPGEHIVQRSTHERFFTCDGSHERFGVACVLAHVGVTCVARRGDTACINNLVAFFRRTKLDMIVKLQRAT